MNLTIQHTHKHTYDNESAHDYVPVHCICYLVVLPVAGKFIELHVHVNGRQKDKGRNNQIRAKITTAP